MFLIADIVGENRYTSAFLNIQQIIVRRILTLFFRQTCRILLQHQNHFIAVYIHRADACRAVACLRSHFPDLFHLLPCGNDTHRTSPQQIEIFSVRLHHIALIDPKGLYIGLGIPLRLLGSLHQTFLFHALRSTRGECAFLRQIGHRILHDHCAIPHT